MYSEFDKKMKKKELYSEIRAPENSYLVVRVDGKNFHKVTDTFQKPFDNDLHLAMCRIAHSLLKGLQGIYAYTQSDEVSVLLPRDWKLFDRRVEKINSISASIATCNFIQELEINYPIEFDSRVLVLPTVEDVVDYFSWRQADCTRCCANVYAYWTLRTAEKMNAQAATKYLKNMGFSKINDLLHSHGINFNDIENRWKRGTGYKYMTVRKKGFNPKTKEKTTYFRKNVIRDDQLPMRQDYRRYINNLCGESFVTEWIDFDQAAKKHFTYKSVNKDNELGNWGE